MSAAKKLANPEKKYAPLVMTDVVKQAKKVAKVSKQIQNNNICTNNSIE